MSRKALKISSWNLCNGLANKVQYVSDLIKEEQLDILFLQETEIKEGYDVTLLNVNNYTTELSNTGGTVRTIAYIHDSISYTHVKESIDTNVIMLNLDKKYTLTQVVGIYRQFKRIVNQTLIESFKKQLQQITNFISDRSTVMLLGDVNLDFNKIHIPNYAQRKIYDELLEMAYAFDMTQLVKEITWSRVYQGQTRSSILDHEYINNCDVIETETIEKQPISNHSVVIVKIKGQTSDQKLTPMSITAGKTTPKKH